MVCFMQVFHSLEVCAGDHVEDLFFCHKTLPPMFDVPIMTNCSSLKNFVSDLICSFFLC